MTLSRLKFVAPRLAMLGLVLVVAGCTGRGPDVSRESIFDPYEVANRERHEFNRGLDKNLLRPAGQGYTKVVNQDLQNSISNFSENLSAPSMVVNNLLQGDLLGALKNTYRFVVNTTLGIGGLFDPASEMGGVEAAEADFGQTLYVWGVREGAFVELPFMGPSTERDAVGKVVDLFTNPLSYVIPSPEKYIGTGASVLARVGARGQYSDTIDSILYDSADSYAQSRLIYLQNRRFKLGQVGEADYSDPYSIGYADPYEDPYAQ